MKLKMAHSVVPALALLLAAGCVSRVALPERTFYAFEVAPPAAPTNAAPVPATIEVARLRVAPVCNRQEFVYRRAGLRWQTDYYHAFIVQPGALLFEEISGYLDKGRRFQRVVRPGAGGDDALRLEGNVLGLYGDYADPAHPAAVLEIQFALLHNRAAGEPAVVWMRDLRRVIPLPRDAPPELVAGWNRALTEMLAGLQDELATEAAKEAAAK